MAIFDFNNVRDWHIADKVNIGDDCLAAYSIEELKEINDSSSPDVYRVCSINDYSFNVFSTTWGEKENVPFLYIIKKEPKIISGELFLSRFLENRMLLAKDGFYNNPMLITEVNSGTSDFTVNFCDGINISSKTIQELHDEGYEWYTVKTGWKSFNSNDEE